MRLCSPPFLLLASLAIAWLPATAQSNDDINPAAKSIALAARLPAYDVVSIHENKSGSGESSLNTTDDGVVIENASFAEIVEFAYNIASFDLISGISGPVDSARFDIKAKIAGGDGAQPVRLTDEQLQAMVIPVLAERFHLRVRMVPKRMTVYEMVVAKGGPKFKLNEPDNSSVNFSWGKDNILIFKRSSMATLAGVLSDSGLHGLVVDRSGLKGAGDFTLRWSSDDAEELGGPNLVSVFTAIEDQLGLKLKAVKLPVDTIVVDHVEMPSAD
jgi:uncharacterized protein (TIGR03435 family)